MRFHLAAGAIGLVFGTVLSWTGLISPEVIRSGLLFEDAYLFLFFGAAVATSFVGLRLLRARRPRALLTGERVGWDLPRPQRRQIAGSVIFGIGWAVADACPGPVAAQVGQGIGWGLLTLAGIVLGIALYQARERRPARPARRARRRTADPAVGQEAAAQSAGGGW